MELDLQRFYRVNRPILMWIVFFTGLFLLRQFFALVFITFIFAFVMRNVAKFLTTNTRAPYWAAVVFPYLVVLTLLVLLMVTAIPRVVDEGTEFSRKVPGLLEQLAKEVQKSAKYYGMEPMLAKYVNTAGDKPPAVHSADAGGESAGSDKANLAVLAGSLKQFARSLNAAVTQPAATQAGDEATTPALSDPPDNAALIGAIQEFAESLRRFPTSQAGESGPETIASDTVSTPALVKVLQQLAIGLLPGVSGESQRAGVINLFDTFIGGVVSGTLKFLLAILLSFLIVLDYEAVGTELRKWRESQVGLFFHEAAASVIDFSRVVGRAFQCQIVVALLNATITCIGMAVLGIQPLLLLTTIVFLFGLIPVLGVFISSVPIILIAFNSPEGGLRLALIALGMIVVVHLLEAYVFNPRIYAARFHLNPVIVLIILLVAHELFGVWGMLLGIPVTTYVLNVAQVPALPPPKQRLRKHKGASPSVT